MAIVRLERLGKLINEMTSGIESAIFRLVAYCLNQLRYRTPPNYFNTFLQVYNLCISYWRLSNPLTDYQRF
jgi:hypothetical protein